MKTNMKKLILTGVALAAMTFGANAAIVMGDIAIVGMSGENVHRFDFVTLHDIAAGSTISFTDSGWMRDTNNFGGYEGGVTYTFATDTAAGTVIWGAAGTDAGWEALANWSTISDSALGSGSTDFSVASGDGDQILAFTGSVANPTFVFAASNTLFDAYDTEFGYLALSDFQSQGLTAYTVVPTGLTEGNGAVAQDAQNGTTGWDNFHDNIWYSGPTTFNSATEAFAAISDGANWSGSDSGAAYSPIASLQIVPEPSTWALLLVGTGAMLWVLRRRQSFGNGEAQM